MTNAKLKAMKTLLTEDRPKEQPSLLMSQAEVARAWHVSRLTIYRMTKDAVLHPVMLRGVKRFRRDEIEKVARGGAA